MNLAVIGVAGVALMIAAFAATPTVLNAEIIHIRAMFAGAPGSGPGFGPGMGPAMFNAIDTALIESYHDAIRAIFLAGGASALVTAVAASVFVAGRVAMPMSRIAGAARTIAAGKYDQRVAPTGIAELDSVAASFNDMAASLAAGEQRRLDLIGDVAHELRTPLATLNGYLEGLIDGVVEPDAKTWALLQGETARLTRLVSDLNELSRADARQLRLDITSVRVSDVVEAARVQLSAEAAKLGLALEASVEPDLPDVAADRGRAIQVLTNLLTNALRYTPSPGTIGIAATQSAGGVAISVTDTGIGIAPEELPRIFERFYRVDRSRSRALGGSGVGLSIAKALADAMGGSLTAESAGAGKGSTFTLWLPGLA